MFLALLTKHTMISGISCFSDSSKATNQVAGTNKTSLSKDKRWLLYIITHACSFFVFNFLSVNIWLEVFASPSVLGFILGFQLLDLWICAVNEANWVGRKLEQILEIYINSQLILSECTYKKKPDNRIEL